MFSSWHHIKCLWMLILLMFHLGSTGKASLSPVSTTTKIWFLERGISLFRSHILPLSGQVNNPTFLINVSIIELWLFPVVITFDAHVLKWSLDDNPPDEYTRHHIREASFYGSDTYSFDMVVKVPSSTSGSDESNQGILINYIGLQEKAIWPAKKFFTAEGGFSMALFKKLDPWLQTKTGGTVDALLIGCVAGVTVIWDIYLFRRIYICCDDWLKFLSIDYNLLACYQLKRVMHYELPKSTVKAIKICGTSRDKIAPRIKQVVTALQISAEERNTQFRHCG